jgi:hypothetical protein
MKTDTKEFKDKVEVVRKIGSKELPETITTNIKNGLQGAMLGAFIGSIMAIALRKKFYYGALVGGILGRLISKGIKK